MKILFQICILKSSIRILKDKTIHTKYHKVTVKAFYELVRYQFKSIPLYSFRAHDSEMLGIPFILWLIGVGCIVLNPFIITSVNSSNLESLKMCQEHYIPMNEPNSLPIIKMSYGGNLYCGILGSYCWNDICVDKALPITSPNSAITIKEEKNISFIVDGHKNADTFLISVFRENEKLLEGHDYRIMLDIQAGTYLIQVMGVWKGKGDVSYFFPIKVM